jgi:hypothetical protein
MGNSNLTHGAVIRFPLESAPFLTALSRSIPAHLISAKTGHHVKAFLFTDKSEGWVTYEVTCGMQGGSPGVTILSEKQQTVAFNPQGGAAGTVVTLQLVKVVGRGKVQKVRLYGDSGAQNLGHTSWVRYNNDPDTAGKMRSIKEIDKHAKAVFSEWRYNILTESCQEFATSILRFANYTEGGLATAGTYPAAVDPATGNYDLGNG